MNRRTSLLLTGALVVLGIVSLGYRFLSSKQPIGDSAAEILTAPVATADGVAAAVYFPAVSGMLEPEVHPVPADLDRGQRTRWLAEQLAAGPESERLRPALPPGTGVASVFAAPEGTVFVDFTLKEEAEVGMGSTDEILAIYSVVNTLLLDDETSDRVVILVNGRQRETLAGHVDTSGALRARPDLVRDTR